MAREHRARLHRPLPGRDTQACARDDNLGRGYLLRLVRLDIAARLRRARGDAKDEPGARQVRVWRLLVIQVALAHVARVDLDLVRAHGTGGAEPRHGRAARVGRRHVADFLVVPIHHPRALHRPPSETGDAKLDERADWPFRWMDLEGLSHFDGALRHCLSRVGDRDGMHAAEIFRDVELGRESPGGVDLRSSQELRAVAEPLPSKAVAILNDPAAGDGLPHQIDCSVWRQTGRDRMDLGARHRLGARRGRERESLQSAFVPAVSGCGNPVSTRRQRKDGGGEREIEDGNSQFLIRRWSAERPGPRTA